MKFANEKEGFIPSYIGVLPNGKALGFDPSKRKRLQVRVLHAVSTNLVNSGALSSQC